MNFDDPENGANNKKICYEKLSKGSLIVSILLSIILISTIILRERGLEKTEELRKIYYRGTDVIELSKKSEAQQSEPHKIQKNFEQLLKINPETVGWIKVGKLADEPVVYRDNEHYLNYDFYGHRNSIGTVFIDVENSDWENSKYLILYGHYLKNGGKFGNLKRYKNIEDLKDNLIITWNTIYGKEPEKYVVFSVFESSMLKSEKDYFYLRRFEKLKGGEKEIEKLIEELKKRSIFNIPVEVTPNDKIMCLVTCSYGNKDGRLLVFSRKIRPEEVMDSINDEISGK
ncbi:class B sortase [Peptoniphilus catoniae]|uniref:class B sortase n=1 Tax=Peptoniphilus catoniae TaxID=1660341 RepID=UPI0010FE3C68|nr:class B sortase [Peptoniphilus catoniae]